jgi:DNA polymerase-3 subunit beta
MKLTLDADLLADTIAAAVSSLPAKANPVILGGVLVEAQIGALTMSSFNYERATRRTVAADVGEADTAVVSGRLLTVVGANLPRGKEAAVTVSGAEMVITAGRTAFQLPLMHVEDYPNLPTLSAEADGIGTVDGDSLVQAVQVIGGFASTDIALANLTGLNVAFQPGALWLSATDRYIIGRRRLDWNGDAAATVNVPAADMLATIKAVTGPTAEDVEILHNGSMFGLHTPHTTVMTRCLGDDFPNIGNVLKKAATYTSLSTVATAELAFMLRRASSIADDGNSQVDIEADAGGLSVTTTKSATGKVNDSIAAVHQGDYRKITLSAHRLHSALAVIDAAEVTLAFEKKGHLVGIHPGELHRTGDPVDQMSCDSFALLIGIGAR